MKHTLVFMERIHQYEQLSFQQAFKELRERSKAITNRSSREKIVDFYCFYMAALTTSITFQENYDITRLKVLDKYVERAYDIAEKYIRSPKSLSVLNEERKEIIAWLESKVLNIPYYDLLGKEPLDFTYEGDVCRHLTECRSDMMNVYLTYTDEQVNDLRRVNNLCIKAGTELFYKVKSLQKCRDDNRSIFPDTEALCMLAPSFEKHEATPFDLWISRQLEDPDVIYEWWNADISEKKDPSEYVYLMTNEDMEMTDEQVSWNEGLERDKLQGIPICFLFHDLKESQTVGYDMLDILRIKELREKACMHDFYCQTEEKDWPALFFETAQMLRHTNELLIRIATKFYRQVRQLHRFLPELERANKADGFSHIELSGQVEVFSTVRSMHAPVFGHRPVDDKDFIPYVWNQGDSERFPSLHSFIYQPFEKGQENNPAIDNDMLETIGPMCFGMQKLLYDSDYTLEDINEGLLFCCDIDLKTDKVMTIEEANA